MTEARKQYLTRLVRNASRQDEGHAHYQHLLDEALTDSQGTGAEWDYLASLCQKFGMFVFGLDRTKNR